MPGLHIFEHFKKHKDGSLPLRIYCLNRDLPKPETDTQTKMFLNNVQGWSLMSTSDYFSTQKEG